MIAALTPLKKRTIFKIAVELIKADDRIHSKEISFLERLQRELELSQEDIDLTHYITLSEAVSSINELDEEQIDYVMKQFNRIMRADSDIAMKENLLLTAISMACSKESRSWAQVVSVPSSETKVPSSHVAFFEKTWVRDAHLVFDDVYDNMLISKAFGDIGFRLFYLPSVLKDLGLTNRSANERGEHMGLLRKSIEYLAPYGRKTSRTDVEQLLTGFDSATFFKVFLSSFHLNPDVFPYDSFLLVKVRDSVVFDDSGSRNEVVDFLCIDMSAEVKKRILSFVSNFSEDSQVLPYEGYYKMFYDYLSSESKIVSNVLIDRKFQFFLENLDGIRLNFESSPQARTFYLLLLHYGRVGVGQSCFVAALEYLQSISLEEFCRAEDSFDIDMFLLRLRNLNTDWSKLIYNTICIYRQVSTKDEYKPTYLSYVQSIFNHRSSLKTYINTGFSEVDGLADPYRYHIIFDKEFNLYRVEVSPSFFIVEEENAKVPLMSSVWWTKNLI